MRDTDVRPSPSSDPSDDLARRRLSSSPFAMKTVTMILTAVLACVALMRLTGLTGASVASTRTSGSGARAGGSCGCDLVGGGVGGRGQLCAPVIDVVYTWVNGSDPHFAEQLRKYKAEWAREHGESATPPPPPPPPPPSKRKRDGSKAARAREDEEDFERDAVESVGKKKKKTAAERDADAVSDSRFNDHQELRYSLRSIWMYAPWVRNVYIVTNGQVPTWLDLSHPRLKVVPHSEIFPNASHLPTFSSPAIEAHVHRIPGLSDKFLYLNDDVMFGREVWPDDFTTPSRGQKIYLAWKVPDCAESCTPYYLGDGTCDVGCNTTLCNFDLGDCLGPDVKVRKGWGGYSDDEEYLTKCNAGKCSYDWIGDKYCDKACLTLDCGYDAADCWDSSKDKIQANILSVHVTNDVKRIEINVTEPSLQLNLSAIFPKGEIQDASHSNRALVVAASVSQKHSLLTIVFSAEGSNANSSVNITLTGKGPDRSVHTHQFTVAFIGEDGDWRVPEGEGEDYSYKPRKYADGDRDAVDEDDWNYGGDVKDGVNPFAGDATDIADDESSQTEPDDEVEGEAKAFADRMEETVGERRLAQFSVRGLTHDQRVGERRVEDEQPMQGLSGGGIRRRLLDVYGDSLKHVNALMDREFGVVSRRVPSHMPHLIDRHVMEELQAFWPERFDATSSHRFRHSEDMQFALSYMYWLMSARRGRKAREFLREMDADADGKLDRLELRLMCAHLSVHSRDGEIDERRLRARLLGWMPKIPVWARHNDRYDWVVERIQKQKEERAERERQRKARRQERARRKGVTQKSGYDDNHPPMLHVEGYTDDDDQFYGEDAEEALNPYSVQSEDEREREDALTETFRQRGALSSSSGDSTSGFWGPTPMGGSKTNREESSWRSGNVLGNFTGRLGAVASKFASYISPEAAAEAEKRKLAEVLKRDDPVPLSTIYRDAPFMKLIEDSLRKEKKYKYEMGDTKDVGFFMLKDSRSAFMNELEALRAKPPKFICFNDDLNGTHPDPYVMRELEDFLHTLYPKRSPFELPLGPAGPDGRQREVGGFASLDEWEAELRSRAGSRAGAWLMLLALVLAVYTLRRMGDDIAGSVQHFRRLRQERLRRNKIHPKMAEHGGRAPSYSVTDRV